MTITEARLHYPKLQISDVPYLHPHVGEDYRIITGRLATLGYKGNLLIADQLQRITVHFTGAQLMFAVKLHVQQNNQTCQTVFDRLQSDYGDPIIDDRPHYALWRKIVVLGPELEWRCLDNQNGAYSIVLSQPLLQQIYIRNLNKELEPAISAALQFLR